MRRKEKKEMVERDVPETVVGYECLHEGCKAPAKSTHE